jgi:hypothetical protein
VPVNCTQKEAELREMRLEVGSDFAIAGLHTQEPNKAEYKKLFKNNSWYYILKDSIENNEFATM